MTALSYFFNLHYICFLIDIYYILYILYDAYISYFKEFDLHGDCFVYIMIIVKSQVVTTNSFKIEKNPIFCSVFRNDKYKYMLKIEMYEVISSYSLSQK